MKWVDAGTSADACPARTSPDTCGVPKAGSLIPRFQSVLELHHCHQTRAPRGQPDSEGPQCAGDDVDESRTWRQKPGGTNLSE